MWTNTYYWYYKYLYYKYPAGMFVPGRGLATILALPKFGELRQVLRTGWLAQYHRLG